MFRGVLQRKLTEQKLPFRQAVFESLKCFDDSFLDAIDDADISKLSQYSVVIECCDCYDESLPINSLSSQYSSLAFLDIYRNLHENEMSQVDFLK